MNNRRYTSNYSRYVRDARRRRSFSYRFKRWFWSNHTKEIKMVFILVGQFIISLLWFGTFIFLPHIFH